MDITNLPCLRCGTCCSLYQPLITDEEAKRIADYKGMTLEEFFNEYADYRWPIGGKHLIKHVDGHCALMRIEGKQHLCDVHLVKPTDCWEWKESLEKKECKTGLLSEWNLKVDENGEIVGDEATLEAFKEYLDSLEIVIPDFAK